MGTAEEVAEVNETWNLKFPEAITSDELVFARIDEGGYEGSAFVLYRRNGKLWEVNDSHCSCNGWENWSPEETTLEAIKMRPSYPLSENDVKIIEELLGSHSTS